MLISPMLRGHIEEEDPAVGTKKEMLGSRREARQMRHPGRHGGKGLENELSSMLNVSERSHKMRPEKNHKRPQI